MISPDSLSQWMRTVVGIAQEGGEVLKKFWGHLPAIQEKNFPGDLVTEADRQSEELILRALQQNFPAYPILAEESGLSSQLSSDFIWIVDPLDGTTNYAHQYPMVAISIGLLYQGEPILGVIYNPLTAELYTAAKGLGSKLNGRSIQVSAIPSLKDSLLATGFAYDRRETPDNNYAEFCHFTHLTQGVRRAGAASLDLAYVACGRLDGYWERGLKPWDMAAGIVLVREAGGWVSDYDLNPVNLQSGRILATNPLLQQAISQELLALRSKKPSSNC
ncbi:inositol monophosphatase family protein [Candidatus Protochlamydia phocaeensis]|uniref:inositol monophosphatase family protein n=1 Tax=Candidatus Protochlamydia phocaeensis TaxID=1414722 RepID=UPI000839390D|nr:inositol monophosphatase family protein [Candidatus Protochlamydia phocaeensis]